MKLRPTGTDFFTEVSASALHFVELEISNHELRASVVGLEGIIDEFTIPYAQSNQP